MEDGYLYKDVLKDAPDWPVAENKAAVMRREAGTGEASRKQLSNDIEKLLARIAKTKLPEAYEPVAHQDYVDKRIEGMTEDQRRRLFELWTEKQRLV